MLLYNPCLELAISALEREKTDLLSLTIKVNEFSFSRRLIYDIVTKKFIVGCFTPHREDKFELPNSGSNERQYYFDDLEYAIKFILS